MSKQDTTAGRMEKIREMAGAIPARTPNGDSNEIAAQQPRIFTDAELRSIDSFDAALAALDSKGMQIRDAADYIGSGFTIAEQKKMLEGVPLLFLSWRFNESSRYPGVEFVSANVITKHGDKLIINDGTKGGIRDQLREFTEQTGHYGGCRADHGLHVSEYDLTDDHGDKVGEGCSYYIRTS